jgi:hypothetical protein
VVKKRPHHPFFLSTHDRTEASWLFLPHPHHCSKGKCVFSPCPWCVWNKLKLHAFVDRGSRSDISMVLRRESGTHRIGAEKDMIETSAEALSPVRVWESRRGNAPRVWWGSSSAPSERGRNGDHCGLPNIKNQRWKTSLPNGAGAGAGRLKTSWTTSSRAGGKGLADAGWRVADGGVRG